MKCLLCCFGILFLDPAIICPLWLFHCAGARRTLPKEKERVSVLGDLTMVSVGVAMPVLYHPQEGCVPADALLCAACRWILHKLDCCIFLGVLQKILALTGSSNYCEGCFRHKLFQAQGSDSCSYMGEKIMRKGPLFHYYFCRCNR